MNVSARRASRPRRTRRAGARGTLATIALLLAAAPACEGLRGAPDPLAGDPTARAAEIERLEAQIERDRASLETIVTTPRDIEQAPLHEDAALRAIAERLAADAQRLDQLRAIDASGAGEG